MVKSQYNPVPSFAGADHRHPEGRLVVEVAYRGAFGGADPSDLLVDVDVDVEFEVLPRYVRFSGDDLRRLVESLAEPGRQVGVAVDDGLHGAVQTTGVEWAGDGHVELHRIQVTEVRRVLVWKSSPCCIGVTGKMSAMSYCCLQFVDLVLAEPCGSDV